MNEYTSVKQPEVPSALRVIGGIRLTPHAWERMCQRGASPKEMVQAIDFGTIRRQRQDRMLHVVTRRDVQNWRRKGIRIESLLGVHVVTYREHVLTVWRDRRCGGVR